MNSMMSSSTPRTNNIRMKVPLVAIYAHQCLDFAEKLEEELNASIQKNIELSSKLIDAQLLIGDDDLIDWIKMMQKEFDDKHVIYGKIMDERDAWKARAQEAEKQLGMF